MFEDYLNNKESYERLECYFVNMFLEEIRSRNIPPTEFRLPHYNARFVDGTPFMDANPIFSASHLSTKNILRVVITDDVSEFSTNENVIDDFLETCAIMKIYEINKARIIISNWIETQVQLSP